MENGIVLVYQQTKNIYMQQFHSYNKNNMGGFEHCGAAMEFIDQNNQRILREEQYKLLKMQESEIKAQQEFRELSKQEILDQQKYRKEQSQGAKFEKRLLIFNTIIAITALLVSIFK